MKPNLRSLTRLAVVGLVFLILLSYLLCFQVRETEQVVVTRFGEPVRVITQAGLYEKLPWPIETVNRVDVRLNFHEVRLAESLTRDKRNLIVPVYIAWRVADPLKFLEAMSTIENAESKLDGLTGSAESTILGSYDFKQLVSANPDDVKLGEIEQKLTDAVSSQAQGAFGIRVEQIGIERVTLPEANTAAVFERMRSERSQFAEQYLAEGRQQADAIRARTDAQKTVILAEAQKDAEMKRGEAEAAASHIYSQAHSQNPDFYLLLREVDTLKKILSQNTTLVLDANSAPFNLLKADPGSMLNSSDHEPAKK